MRVLFLDLSKTNCGWAVDNPNRAFPPMTGSWSPAMTEIKRGPLGHSFQRWLWNRLGEWSPALVFYEKPVVTSKRFKGGRRELIHDFHGHMILFGLPFAVESVCASLKIPCEPIAVNTVRKAFLGNGNLPKEAVVEKCREMGWPVHNDDEADAAAGWVCAKMNNDDHFFWSDKPLFLAGRGNGEKLC